MTREESIDVRKYTDIGKDGTVTLYDLCMRPVEALWLRDIRSAIIPCASGETLEVGIGTGANCPYYDGTRLDSLTALDREYSPVLARRVFAKPLTFTRGPLERMPFNNGVFDSVVATLVLCTADADKSLREIRRVLKPGGTFIFIEHVRPRGERSGKVCDALNGVWSRVVKGCNLNRRTDELLERAGFAQLNMQRKCASGVFIYGTATN